MFKASGSFWGALVKVRIQALRFCEFRAFEMEHPGKPCPESHPYTA